MLSGPLGTESTRLWRAEQSRAHPAFTAGTRRSPQPNQGHLFRARPPPASEGSRAGCGAEAAAKSDPHSSQVSDSSWTMRQDTTHRWFRLVCLQKGEEALETLGLMPHEQPAAGGLSKEKHI